MIGGVFFLWFRCALWASNGREQRIVYAGHDTIYVYRCKFMHRDYSAYNQKKMGTLLDRLQSVSGGDLSVQLGTKGAGKYEAIYQSLNRMVFELKNTKENGQFCE